MSLNKEKKQKIRTWAVICVAGVLAILFVFNIAQRTYVAYQKRKETERKEEIMRKAAPLLAKKRIEAEKRRLEEKDRHEKAMRVIREKQRQADVEKKIQQAMRPKMPDIEFDRTYPVNEGLPVCLSLDAVKKASTYIYQKDAAAFGDMVRAGVCTVTSKDRPVFIIRLDGDYVQVRPAGHDVTAWVSRAAIMRPEY